jgi:hypothetical protein
MFSKAELEVMGRLLALAAEQFGNHGCNDFELPLTEENIALIEQVEPDAELHIVRGNILTLDTSLMYFLEQRCQEELGKLP